MSVSTSRMSGSSSTTRTRPVPIGQFHHGARQVTPDLECAAEVRLVTYIRYGRGSFVRARRLWHAEEKDRERNEGGNTQSHEPRRIAEVVDDFAGNKTAHRSADALDGRNRPLSHVVTARAAHEVR